MRGKAVVLLSGGIDSATSLAVAVEEGLECYTLTIDYGQRHAVEIEAARAVSQTLGAVEHKVVRLDLAGIGGSALTDDIEVPKGGESIGSIIPATYVPARNTVFLSVALAWAEVLGAEYIFIGANTVDYSGYPDCRPEYLEAFRRLSSLATRSGVEGRSPRIEAPLLDLAKSEIVLLGARLGLDYSMTHSCYDPNAEGEACGLCDSCIIRKKGFVEAGVEDPTRYARRRRQ